MTDDDIHTQMGACKTFSKQVREVEARQASNGAENGEKRISLPSRLGSMGERRRLIFPRPKMNLVHFSVKKRYWRNDDCLLEMLKIAPLPLRNVIRCDRSPQWT